MDDNEDPRVRPVLRWYLAGYALSMLGTGLWMPLNAIFLAEQRGLPASGVGGYYATVALCAIAANLFAGSLADRIGPFRPLVVAGVLVHRLGYAGYVIGFGLNAASYAVHALNVAGPVRRLAERVGLAPTGPVAAKPRPNPLGPYRDPRFLPVILTQFCISAFGYAQLEAVVPVVFREAAGLPLWMVTGYTAANCLGVIVFQPRATRWVKRVGPRLGLRAALVAWLASIVPAVTAVLVGPAWLRLLAVVAYALVFAAGETLV